LPAITYKPFELAKGIGTKGAMVRMPVMIPTIQLVLNRNLLPEGTGQASRNYWLSQYDRVMQVIAKAEAGVPANVWFDVPLDSVMDYMEALRQSRVSGAEQGLYNKRTLNLIKKARCQISPASAECASATEVQ
jgi:hypothetical protein